MTLYLFIYLYLVNKNFNYLTWQWPLKVNTTLRSSHFLKVRRCEKYSLKKSIKSLIVFVIWFLFDSFKTSNFKNIFIVVICNLHNDFFESQYKVFVLFLFLLLKQRFQLFSEFCFNFLVFLKFFLKLF